MIDTPQIVQTKDQPYAFIHLKIPRAEMHAVLPPTLNELFAAVKEQGLLIVPWFAHHLTLSDGYFDFEACIPVDTTFTPTGRVQRGLWPSGTVARTVYQGDYSGLPGAWREFNTWIRQQGHTYAGHIYEHYIVNQGTTKIPAEFRTEMSWPLITLATESEQA
jgi:effector-binding domain-containing protein